MAVATADHVVSREDAIWTFGPDLEPVLEVEPGATVTLPTNDYFTGQIEAEDELVTAIDITRATPRQVPWPCACGCRKLGSRGLSGGSLRFAV